MRRIIRLCVLGLYAGAIMRISADDAMVAPPLISGKDLYQLNFTQGVRYDSNPDAVAAPRQAEVDGSASAGGTVTSTLDALDRVALSGMVEAVDSNRDEDRRELLGGAVFRFNRIEEIDSLVVSGQWSRSDDPNQLTGSRVVVDAYRGDAKYEWMDERNRYAVIGSAVYTGFLDGVAGIPASDLDSTTAELGFSYGRKISETSLLTLRLGVDETIYNSTAVSQDNQGISLLGGWASQVNEQEAWSLEAGVEVKHYDADAAGPAYNGVSPTVQASLRMPWANRGQLTLAVRENLATSVFGNPAIVSTATIDGSHPLGDDWTGRIGCGGSQIRDIHSNRGQPEDLRTTLQLRCGSLYRLTSGLSFDASVFYELGDAHIASDYRRVGGMATLTETF